MLGIGKLDAFGIDKNAFKTDGERRVAEQARHREQAVQTTEHLRQIDVKDERVDTHFEAKALDTVGRKRPVTAPAVGASAPSGESSGLKAQELKV